MMTRTAQWAENAHEPDKLTIVHASRANGS
jgi:hypothetical protein